MDPSGPPPPPFPYDSGPKKMLERPPDYIARVTAAREFMGYIPKNKVPPAPDKANHADAADYRNACAQYEKALRSAETMHARKLTNGDPWYDAMYAKQWRDQKQKRRERNKEAREATWLKRKVQDINYGRPVVERPKSPESSGDERTYRTVPITD